MRGFRKVFERDNKSIVKDNGHIELSTACVRANKTGFFALGERVNPDSYDGNDTDINAKDCFFGGRKIDIACTLKNASELASKSVSGNDNADNGTGIDSGTGNEN